MNAASESAPVRPTAYVVEGECLATITKTESAQLERTVRDLTRMIENSNLSADALEMSEALRTACRAELDSRVAR